MIIRISYSTLRARDREYVSDNFELETDNMWVATAMRSSILLILPRPYADTNNVYGAGSPDIVRHLFMESALTFDSLNKSTHNESVYPGLRKLSIRNVGKFGCWHMTCRHPLQGSTSSWRGHGADVHFLSPVWMTEKAQVSKLGLRMFYRST